MTNCIDCLRWQKEGRGDGRGLGVRNWGWVKGGWEGVREKGVTFSDDGSFGQSPSVPFFLSRFFLVYSFTFRPSPFFPPFRSFLFLSYRLFFLLLPLSFLFYIFASFWVLLSPLFSRFFPCMFRPISPFLNLSAFVFSLCCIVLFFLFFYLTTFLFLFLFNFFRFFPLVSMSAPPRPPPPPPPPPTHFFSSVSSNTYRLMIFLNQSPLSPPPLLPHRSPVLSFPIVPPFIYAFLILFFSFFLLYLFNCSPIPDYFFYLSLLFFFSFFFLFVVSFLYFGSLLCAISPSVLHVSLPPLPSNSLLFLPIFNPLSL
jgi:hypothetical protein